MIPYRFNPMGMQIAGEPIPGSRGVFLTSAGVDVSSAMVVSGGTIGTGYDADVATVYRRGRVVAETVLIGGAVYVSSGGAMVDNTLYGYAYVYSGGIARSGSVQSATGAYARLHVSGGTAADMTVYSGGQMILRDGGVTSGGVIYRAGAAYVSSGCVASDIVVSSAGILNITSGGAAYDVTSAANANITVAEGGTITYKS